MSDLRTLADTLTNLRRRAEAATPGDWYVDSTGHGVEAQTEDAVAIEIVSWTSREWAAYIAAANPQAVIGLLDKVDASASRWRWTVATTPGGGAALSYRAPGQLGFALIASALPRGDGMLAVTVLGQKRTAADDLPAALATIRAILGADVPAIPTPERSES